MQAVELTREFMLGNISKGDKTFNGKFIVGVKTTGIYCLPSCPARTPKPENIEFYSSPSEARSAGLRACKRCKPDDFYRDFDPDLEKMKLATAKIRLDPGAFADISAVSDEYEIGLTKLNSLFRLHYHLTPAAFLSRCRISKACDLLSRHESQEETILSISNAVGYESLSAFNENFRRQTGMTPTEFRQLGHSDSFTLKLPADYRKEFFFQLQERDREGLMERVEGNKITKALAINSKGVLLHLDFKEGNVDCRVEGQARREDYFKLHAIVIRMLGLTQDPAPFERKCEEQGLEGLIQPRRGMRIPQSAEPFEGLVWAIVGQQVTVAFATQLRRYLAELCGTKIGDFIAHPTAEQIAGLEYEQLMPLKFSRRKAEYLIDTARMIVSGALPFDDYANYPASQVEKELMAVRGLGVWSVNYLMLRAFGFGDCTPLGDTGLRSALHKFRQLDAQPTPEKVAELMEPFAPHRSLATYHLWYSLKD